MDSIRVEPATSINLTKASTTNVPHECYLTYLWRELYLKLCIVMIGWKKGRGMNPSTHIIWLYTIPCEQAIHRGMRVGIFNI